jgi:uncharacterized membrane protein
MAVSDETATGLVPAPARAVIPEAAQQVPHRVAAIDIVRGAVMILMAIDHVRVFSGVPAGGPTPAVFFTRWITNSVAPAFVFLAGTAALLHGRRLGSRAALARFLLTRGAWLVLLELTVVRLAWTFNFDYGTYLLAGVIWVLGLCMILLAPLVFLRPAAIAVFGITIIAGHNLMDYLPQAAFAALSRSPLSWLYQVLYFGDAIQLGAQGPLLVVLYTVVPWIGVMAAGYAFGTVMLLPAARRRSVCIRLGLAASALFVVLRAADGYGEPRAWRLPPSPPAQQSAPPASASAQPGPPPAVRSAPPAVLRFLGTSKYPASLQFLLMTLGPMLLALGLLEHARGRVADVLATFGRVPLLYYLLHIPLIHLAAIVVSLLRTGSVDPWLFANHPMMMPEPPEGYMWSLPLLYLVTAGVVVLLYFPCRRFARLKQERRDSRWLSYL